MTLVIVVPVYNDWAALSLLITALDRALLAGGRSAALLVVDDGSATPPGAHVDGLRPEALASIDVLHLRRNLGHQRAIAVALAYIEATGIPDVVVIMDGDGEDRPEDVDRLVRALETDGAKRIVFAERTRRSEGLVFSVLYWLYRTMHRALTGESVRVGNFCAVPGPLLRGLVAVSDLWNHFAASVFHSRIPFTTVPADRGRRYAGRSQMDFVALVTHGLSAMSVFGDRVGVRLLLITLALTLGAIAAALMAVGWHLAAAVPMPGWFPYAGVALVMLIFLSVATSLAFVFIILSGRGSLGFLPLRDYGHYVSHVVSIPLSRLNAEQPLHRH